MVGKNEAVTMYSPHKREEGGVTYYYGSIGKGVYFDSAEIRVMKDTGVTFEANEKNRLIEPETTDYLYVPSIHRFGLVKKTSSVSINDFVKFLIQSTQGAAIEPEKLEIDFGRNPSIIQEIFQAEKVYELSYEITYTNNDALPSQGDLLDEILKEGNIGSLKVNAKSDHHDEGLNIEKVPILGGGLELAKNNGKINTAKILPKQGRKVKRISNTETPKIEEFEIPDQYQQENILWIKKFLKLHQDGDI